MMSDAQMWALIVGFVAPLLIAVLQRPTWPDWLRSLVTVCFCAIAGTGTVYFTGNLTGRSILSATLLVFVTSIAAYKGLWKPTSVAPRIEAKTS
jgi:hypothetical protein